MIQLSKNPNIPASLIREEVSTEKNRIQDMIVRGTSPSYRDFKSDIYGAEDVRSQLLEDQHEKCIFCECTLLDKEGGEVEHYRPKTACRQDETKGNTIKPAYYKLAYDWNNLSLCCHACNRRKSTFFPLENPECRFDLEEEKPLLINPYIENPAVHLEFRQAKLYPLTDEDGNIDENGRLTIKFLGLNRKDLVERRRRILNKFIKNMSRLNLAFDQYLEQEKQDEIDEGRAPESIEYYGMFLTQKYKF